MRNSEVKAKAVAAGVRSYEIAEELGVSESTWCRMLRRQMDAETRKKVLAAIKTVQQKHKEGGI